MSGHTPEPWRVDENGLAGYGDNGCNFTIRAGGDEDNPRDGDEVATIPLEHKLLDYGETEDYLVAKANARRIVACVNACAGLSDSALESGVIEKAREALDAAIPGLCDLVAQHGEALPESIKARDIEARDLAIEALALLEAKP